MAAITMLDIVNRSLARLRIPLLKSLTETGPVGDAVRASLTGVRQALLRRHPWRFAMARTVLGAVEPGVPFGWRYRHPLPKSSGLSNTPLQAGVWLRFNGVWGTDDERLPQVEHTVEGDFVLANVTPLYVKYVADQPKTVSDSLFADALVYALAEELALALKQSTELSEQMRVRLQDALMVARSANAFDASPPPVIATYEPDPLGEYFRY